MELNGTAVWQLCHKSFVSLLSLSQPGGHRALGFGGEVIVERVWVAAVQPGQCSGLDFIYYATHGALFRAARDQPRRADDERQRQAKSDDAVQVTPPAGVDWMTPV